MEKTTVIAKKGLPIICSLHCRKLKFYRDAKTKKMAYFCSDLKKEILGRECGTIAILNVPLNVPLICKRKHLIKLQILANQYKSLKFFFNLGGIG
jgi:hypothetical protein